MLLLFQGINFVVICQSWGENDFRQDRVNFQLCSSLGFRMFCKTESFYSSQDGSYGS